MKKKSLGLLEGLLFFAMVVILVLCPLFVTLAPGTSPESVVPLFVVIANDPLRVAALASCVFLPLFIAWGIIKITFSFRLKGEAEEKASFWLYFVWAALGLGYLVFTAKDGSYLAFFVEILFTGSSVIFYYLDRHLHAKK